MKKALALITFISIIYLIGFSNSFAQMPLHPDLIKKIKEGSVNIKIDSNEVKELRARGIDAGWRSEKLLKQSGNNNPLRIFGPAVAPKGTYRALAILVTFSDKQFQTPAAYFDQILFSGNVGTLNNYYKEISYNTLDIVTVNLPSATGIINAPQPYSYYVDNKKGFGDYPRNAQKLVEDVVKAADPIVDFSKYDNDGDGVVDALFIIHAGPGFEFTGNTNDIHSHSWAVNNKPILDGVTISSYTIEPEYMKRPGDMTFGVFAHELGHSAFGLPDLYDTDYSSYGLGNWSLMAGGSWNGTNNNGSSPAHPDAWCLIQMGFVNPTAVSTDASISVPPIIDNPVVYKMNKNGQNSSEYYLIENRQLQGYDSKLPGSGLLVYHVDDKITSSDNDHEWYPGKPDLTQHYHVALIQADGQWDLEKNKDEGDDGDPFPGSSENFLFDYSSVPNSKSWTSAYSGIAIRNITQSGNNINANFIIDDDLLSSSRIVDYGSLEVNSGSDTVSFSISNYGSNSVTINNLSFTSPNFILINTSLPATLPPSGSLTAKFQFTPTNKGQFTDTIKVITSPAKPIGNIIITAKSYVINPVNNDIIYGSLGPSGNGKIISISPQNGAGTEIGVSGFSDIKSLTVNRAENELYGLSNSGTSSQILRINSQGGDAYSKSSLNVNLTSIAFDNSNNLYGITGDGLLYLIDKNTGTYNLIWTTGLNISAIAFNPIDNQLWATAGINSSDKDMTYKLDIGNKNVIQIGKTGFNTYTNAIAFDNQGNLYGIRGNVLQLNPLFKINNSTGTGTDIGSTGFKGVRGIAMASGNATGIENSQVKNILTYKLDQNYPNPFNPVTVINYQIPEKTGVTIRVFNLLGQEISTLVNEEQNAGAYSVKFNAGNLTSGLYIYQIKTAKFTQSRKMVLLK